MRCSRAVNQMHSEPCRTRAWPVLEDGPSTTAPTSRRALPATSRSRPRRTCPRLAVPLHRCAATSRFPTPRSLQATRRTAPRWRSARRWAAMKSRWTSRGTTVDRSSRTPSCTSSGSTTRKRQLSCSSRHVPAAFAHCSRRCSTTHRTAATGAHGPTRERSRSAMTKTCWGCIATPCEPCPGFRTAQRTALAYADVVFVASASEGKGIRALGVERVFAAYVPAPHDVPPSDPGVAPYVLAVAPVGPLHASATLARAAARAGLPVRFTGAVVDGAYAARARSYLDDRSSFAPGDPGSGARVVADVSWSGTDLSALASHAMHGVPIVGSNRAGVREVLGSNGVWEVDPADEVAIAVALCEAWNGAADHAAALARNVTARCRVDVLQACLVSAYAVPEQVA